MASCYFQATCLIAFVHDKLVRLISHQFIAGQISTEEECTMINDEYVTKITIEFEDFLRRQKTSQDKRVATCAVFVEMAHDYLEFVNAYQVGDSVGIECG